MSDLLVIVPTRGRPSSAQRLGLCFDADSHAQLLLVVDEDDVMLPVYQALEGDHMLLVAPRMRPGIVDPLNWACHQVELPRYVGFMGDDHLPQGSWCCDVVDSLDALETGIVYGNDLLQGEKLATAAFMTSNIVKTLGYMSPPELAHLWVDNYWMSLGRGIDRLRYLPNTIVEHLHPLNGKADWDPTYEQCNNPNAGPDREAFHKMLRNGRMDEDIAKVRELL